MLEMVLKNCKRYKLSAINSIKSVEEVLPEELGL